MSTTGLKVQHPVDSPRTLRTSRSRFLLDELSGSMGDLGTFLPLAAAMAVANRMDLGVIFLFAGLMNIATGFLFRQPIPVQPMKAIAAVAITEGLNTSEIAAAGITMGIIVTMLAGTGAITWIDRRVPRPVVRAIQAGVGAKLILKAVEWVIPLPMFGIDSVLASVGVLFFILLFARKIPGVALIAFLLGLIGVWMSESFAPISLHFGLPPLHFIVPTAHDWSTGITRGALPQLPLTLLNSVIAICALSSDLFPGRGVHPRRMAMSVGLMNLLCVPFGAMPMCHGSGGLAAQYRFGARTGLSVIMLGLVKVVLAIVLGVAILPVIESYPHSILAAMILLAGWTLMKPAFDSFYSIKPAVVVIVSSTLIVFVGTLEGFLVGCALWLIISMIHPVERVKS
jgi:MFS superfamily sulfate permease-like transporter